MNVTNYPAELRDCKFTVRFEWLYEAMQRKFGVYQGFPTMWMTSVTWSMRLRVSWIRGVPRSVEAKVKAGRLKVMIVGNSARVEWMYH